MTTMREDADGAPTGPVPPGDRSVIATIRGLRWWATLLLALVLTVAGVTVDLVTSDQLGVAFVACYGAGCIFAIVWAKRSEMFVPMVQPPLLLAVSVPAVIAATGSLPSSGGLVAIALAIGGPMINGFPTMAITTAICLAIAFVRAKLQPWTRPSDELDPEPERRPVRPDRRPTERLRDERGRDERVRDERGRGERGREQGGDPRRPGPGSQSGRRPREATRRPDRDDRPGDDPPRRPAEERARRPDDRPRRPDDRPRRPDDRPRRPVDDRDPPLEKRPPREEMRGREAGPGVYRPPGRPPPG